MNLLFFTHEKEYGGSSRALVALIKELKDNNKIYVVTPFKDSKIIPELEKMNIEVINSFYSWWQVPVNISVLKKILFRIAYLYNSITISKLTRKIKKLNIDIIHSNTSVIDIGSKIANKLNIPHVWHFREFTKNNVDFIKGEKKSYTYINNYGGNIIYISKAIEDFYSKKINKNKAKLIYDGVSKDFIINDKEYKEEYNTVNFLIAGTLHKGKGQHLAVQALGKLKQEGYNNTRLYIAGGDPVGYSQYLKSLIEKYDIVENVKYLGFVKDLKEIRKNVDIELLCAESEAFGLVTIEGMLAGNVMIGSDSGATSELINNGETGFLYKCNDIDDLADKMKYVIDNSIIIEKIGRKAQKYALENFLSEKNAEQINKYYKEILEVAE